MADSDVLLKSVVAAHGDPIRIVQLHVGDTLLQATEGIAAAPPAPHLTYRNGPLMTNVEVFTIFWGPGWQQAPNSALVTQINQFFDFILTSALIDEMHEYSVPGKKIAHGKRTGSIMIATPKLHPSVSDAALQHMLQHEITTNAAVPKPMPNALYFVYLEPGVKVVQGGAASCQAFCGYHSDISGQIFYAAMPFPGCGGCRGSLTLFDALTTTSSHELCEAITDPVPGQGWYDDQNGEIGDICAWKIKKLGAYTVQLEWSNRAGQCV